MQSLVAISRSCTHVGGPAPWDGGVAGPYKNAFLTCHFYCVIVPNLVVLDQMVERTYGDPPKNGRSRPDFQGQSKLTGGAIG